MSLPRANDTSPARATIQPAMLPQLRIDTDLIIKSLLVTKHLKGAINWGDLYCSEAQLVHNDDGSRWYRVVVEEAAPEACELTGYVLEKLVALGWPDSTEVSTEW